MQQVQSKRTTVDVDTRRAVIVVAKARKPKDVATVNHETFIRNALKDRMGWPRNEPAPETIKEAAKQMAAFLVQRDKDEADKKAAEKAAAESAKAEGV
jgi:predicted type IV restriction endonuclease